MSTIDIRKLTGADESRIIARWQDGDFVYADEDARFTEDEQVQQMDESELLRFFDGPYVFAVPSEDENAGENAYLGQFEKSEKTYVDSLDEAPDDAVVHCEPGDGGRLYYQP